MFCLLSTTYSIFIFHFYSLLHFCYSNQNTICSEKIFSLIKGTCSHCLHVMDLLTVSLNIINMNIQNEISQTLSTLHWWKILWISSIFQEAKHIASKLSWRFAHWAIAYVQQMDSFRFFWMPCLHPCFIIIGEHSATFVQCLVPFFKLVSERSR